MTAALGWLGSALVILSLTQRRLRRLRQVNLAACVVLGVFNLMLGIESMIVLNAVLAGINVYHLTAERHDLSGALERIRGFTRPGTARLATGTRPTPARMR